MATFRDTPYGAFNFLVSLGGAQGDGNEGTIIGGFSEVSGFGTEITIAEYRNGNERFNSPRKIPGANKVDDVTLKRGLVGSTDLFEWIKTVRDGTAERRNVTVTLLNEAREPVMTYLFRNALPKKYSGPTLSAKGTEVAAEELVLSVEGSEQI